MKTVACNPCGTLCLCLPGPVWDGAPEDVAAGIRPYRFLRHPTSSAPRPLAPTIALPLTPKSPGPLRKEGLAVRNPCPCPGKGYRPPQTQVGLLLPSLLLSQGFPGVPHLLPSHLSLCISL